MNATNVFPDAGADVAVLGCGRMGSAVARTLDRAGYNVVVWNRTRTKADALALESDRIVAVDTVADAANAAPVVISVVLSYRELLDVLAKFDHARPEVVLNFATGYHQDAASALAFCSERGIGYLDGVIVCYPQYLGRPETMLLVGGAEPLWQRVSSLVFALGGASRYLGADISGPNIIDVGVGGSYFLAATGAFIEALAYMLDHGAEPDDIIATMAAAAPIVTESFEEAVRAAVARSYPAEKASLAVMAYGARGYLSAILASGHSAAALQATVDICELANGTDRCELSFYSLVEQLRKS